MNSAPGLALQIPAAFVDAVARRAAALVLEQINNPPTSHTPWMEFDEAADYLRIPPGTFKKLVSARKVPVHPEGKRNYFHRDELDQWRLGNNTTAAALAA